MCGLTISVGTGMSVLTWVPSRTRLKEMEWTYNKTTYHEFSNSLEMNPHAAVHFGVGGGAGDLGGNNASPNGKSFRFLYP